MSATREDWLSIAAACEGATGPDREIDARIDVALLLRSPGGAAFVALRREYPEFAWRDLPSYTASLDAITAALGEHLSGWAWKVGTCSISDDGWVCPDWNSPTHGRRLRAELGEPQHGHWTDEGFDIDKRPSGAPALALCAALARAMAERSGA